MINAGSTGQDGALQDGAQFAQIARPVVIGERAKCSRIESLAPAAQARARSERIVSSISDGRSSARSRNGGKTIVKQPSHSAKRGSTDADRACGATPDARRPRIARREEPANRRRHARTGQLSTASSRPLQVERQGVGDHRA